jgi:mRNA interferase MazF
MSAPIGPGPERGDAVWINLDETTKGKPSARRAALVVSPGTYNRKVGLALCCPITKETKGYPFEVAIPTGVGVKGAILADQVTSLDWRTRQMKRICRVPETIVTDVLKRAGLLLTSD